jgi:hypothetical protein
MAPLFKLSGKPRPGLFCPGHQAKGGPFRPEAGGGKTDGLNLIPRQILAG